MSIKCSKCDNELNEDEIDVYEVFKLYIPDTIQLPICLTCSDNLIDMMMESEENIKH